MRIGILTGGGDVPGLNPAIKAVVHGAADRGWDVLGLRRGWAALLELNPDDPASRAHNTLPLDTQNTRTIDRTGGTFLHSSRTNPGKVRQKDGSVVDCTPHWPRPSRPASTPARRATSGRPRPGTSPPPGPW